MAQKVEICASDNAQTPLSLPGGLTVSQAAGSYSNLTTGTTTVKSGAGILDRIIVNDPGTTITATIYDNTAGSGTKIATAKLVAGQPLNYGINFATGLTIVLSGTCDITVVYR